MTSKGCKKTTCKSRYKLATRKVEPKHYHKCMQNTQISAGWTVPPLENRLEAQEVSLFLGT